MALFRRTSNESGAAAVEFGLIAGVLFLILFGILAFGEMYSRLQVYEGAAREGARLAAVRATGDEIRARVVEASNPYEGIVEDEDIEVSVAGVAGTCDQSTVGERVEVSWEQSFEIELPFVPSLDIDKRISGVFRCE